MVTNYNHIIDIITFPNISENIYELLKYSYLTNKKLIHITLNMFYGLHILI